MAQTLLPRLYEDQNCVVFDKPPGLLTIPSSKDEKHTLLALANEGVEELFPAHRLDRNTSGAILFAKGKANRDRLMQAFHDRRVSKEYIAFVHGHVRPPQGKIRIPVKDRFRRQFSRQAPAQSALTLYKVSQYRTHYTVVKVNPVTGRTNQIRIHFSKIGHPIVGEDVYAFRKDFALRFRRTALHAAQLSWPNPDNGQMLSVQAPLPEDMKKFLETHQ